MQEGGAATDDNNRESQVEEDEWLVSCRCERAKSVYTLLSCLRNVGAGGNTVIDSRDLSMTQSRRRSLASSAALIQPVTVFCYANSMSFHVIGKSKQTQASINMQAGLFSQYRLLLNEGQAGEDGKTEDWHSEGEFCVNLTTVLQCLNLLGAQSLERMKLSISYNLTQELFKLELTDDAGVLSTAAIPGMQPPEDDLGQTLALAMRSSPVAARLIIKSDTLREILVELESVGGAKVATVSLDAKALEIAVVGDLSECLVSVPCRGDHVVSLECPSVSGNACSFPLHSLLGSLRGLEIAEETCITINNKGMMAIQHQVIDSSTGDGSPSFVDFIMCALDENDDSTEADPEHTQQSYHSARSVRSEAEDSYSQALLSHGFSEKDDNSRRTGSSSIRGTVERDERSGAASSPIRGIESDEDDTDDEEGQPRSNVASLFGSVVGSIPNALQTAEVSRRATRRRMQSPQQKASRRSAGNYDSDASRDLLGDSTDDDDEEELQALDVSTRRNSRNDPDRGNTSSPELVYGRQN